MVLGFKEGDFHFLQRRTSNENQNVYAPFVARDRFGRQ